jgi:hypothetical protein
MTLSTTINKVSYSGTGSQDTFAYTYKIFSSSDIEVYIRNTLGTETKKTITTHYTVSNVGNASGGNIVFTVGNTPLNTDTVIIVRTVPLTQTFDYVLNDPFPSDSHEDGLDKLNLHNHQQIELINYLVLIVVVILQFQQHLEQTEVIGVRLQFTLKEI